MKNRREHKAWAIFWQFRDEEELIPVYKAIDGGLPFFTTKKQATAFVKSLGPPTRARNPPLKWIVKRVTVTATWE